MVSKLEAAIESAKRGLPVFPLRAYDPNTTDSDGPVKAAKKPALADNWKNLATTDKRVISEWWRRNPNYNIGVYTDGLLVIDLDPKGGGIESSQLLELTNGKLPRTYTVVTQSRGAHAYFRLPKGVRVANSVSQIAPGIDVRADGGYVVAPGSEIDGRKYVVRRDEPMALAPQWLIDMCKAPKLKAANAAVRVAEETPEVIERARQYVDRWAPEPNQGGRNHAGYAVAAKMYNLGVSRDTCRELLCEWNDRFATPPMDQAEVFDIADHAELYLQKPIGSESGDVEVFDDETATIVGHDPSSDALEILDDAASKALTHAGDPLIEGIQERGSLIVTFGESGGGKTFLCLDKYYCVAANRPWLGRRVKQGAVLYIAAEGGQGIYKRMAALKQRYPDDKKVPLFVKRASLDLLRQPKDVELVCQWALEAEKRSGLKLEAIVFDTLSRILAGGDENSPTDLGIVVKRIDAIRERTGAAVDLIHHTGKDKSKGARGHSLLRAAADTEIEVNDRRMRVTKQRDMEGDVAFGFRLKAVPLGLDAEGRIVTSCVLEVSENSVHDIPLTPAQQETLDAIDEALESAGGDNTTKIGKKFIQDALKCHGDTPLTNRAILNRVSPLVTNGSLKKVGIDQWVRKCHEVSRSVTN